MRDLYVWLGQELVGVLARLPDRKLRFDYEATYAAGRGATPLSVSMPLRVAKHADRVVDPWLWGLLPDDGRVIERWAREFQVSASSAFSLLATPVGQDCAGAARFSTSNESDSSGGLDSLAERDVADILRTLKRDSSAWLSAGPHSTGQFSLAGAQSKTALARDKDGWARPWGNRPTTHILKPAIVGLKEQEINEHLCLDAAGRAGLLTARTSVEQFEDERALVVERYDRITRDGRLLRVHQEDLCQALGRHPGEKYQSDGGPKPREIVGLFRSVMSQSAARDAVERFIDGLIWNWLVGGTDAHAKNYSLLLAGDDVRLAPLYDISSALPYYHERKLKLAMKVGGKYDVYPAWNTWRKAAAELELSPDAVEARVKALAIRAPAAFSDAAASLESTGITAEMPARLTDLVADRCARCLHMMETTKAL